MAGLWDFLVEEENAFQYSANDHTGMEPLPDLPAPEFSDLGGLLDCDGISAGYALNQPDQILSQSSFSIGFQINQLEYLDPQLPDPFRSAQQFSQPSNTMGPQINQPVYSAPQLPDSINSVRIFSQPSNSMCPQTNQPESLGPELFSFIHSAQLFGQPSNSMGPQINQKEHFGAQHPVPLQSAEPFDLPCDFMGPTNQPNPEQLSEAVKRVQKAAKRKIVDKKHYDKKKKIKKEMEDKVEDLSETIKTLKGRIGNLEEGREIYEAKLISLTKVKDQLRSDLEKSESINKDQVHLVQDLSKQLDQLRSELDKSESKRVELEEQVEKLRSELARPSSDKNYLLSLVPYNSPELKGQPKAQANRMNVILKLEVHDERFMQKAMKTASSLSGVESISMEMKDKELTVIGDVDAVEIVQKLRKVCFTEIISVGPAKEPEKKKEEPKKEESKKADEKKDPVDDPRINHYLQGCPGHLQMVRGEREMVYSFTKTLSSTDVRAHMAVESESMHHLPGVRGERVPIRVTDECNIKVWEFNYLLRKEGHPKPIFQGDWHKYHRDKGLKAGDKVTFTAHNNGTFTIFAERKVWIKF